MADYESTNIEAAAYLAREADPPDDDRPTAAELAEYPACPLCGDPIDYCQGHGERNAVEPYEYGEPATVRAVRALEFGAPVEVRGAVWNGPGKGITTTADFGVYAGGCDLRNVFVIIGDQRRCIDIANVRPDPWTRTGA